jgi:hypothetical protein
VQDQKKIVKIAAEKRVAALVREVFEDDEQVQP